MRHFIFSLLCITTCWAVQNEWESVGPIWNFGIISTCNKGEPRFDKAAYAQIESGDIVWVKAEFIPQFYQEVFPNIGVPFVIVISDGDDSFPSDCTLNCEEIEQFLSSPTVIHIFAQNCDYQGKSDKISHLPIGMDFHTIANGGWGEKGSARDQEALLQEILSRLKPTYLRKKRAFVDFQLSDTMHGGFKRYLQFGEDRASIFQHLLPTNLIDHGPWMRRSSLWRTKGRYAFSISPHGNGLDCHRTWEDLVLGCIVIVKTSPLDPLYEGLPVVIVQNWDEITAENMDKWLDLYGDAFTNPSYREKLTNAYWLSKIQEKRNL